MSAVTFMCDFCGDTEDEVVILIGTPKNIGGAFAHICDGCVDVCSALVVERRKKLDADKTSADMER